MTISAANVRLVRLSGVALFGAQFLLAKDSQAAAAFLNLQGVAGDATDSAHPGWISVLEWNWNETGRPAATGARGSSGRPSVSLTFTKSFDKSSATLAAAVATGRYRGRDAHCWAPTGSPEAVTRLRLPQNVACGFTAPRSSAVDSQHCERLQLPMRKAQFG